MDGSRFDAWTRRGFGLSVAAGGLTGALSRATLFDHAEARKRGRKKKKKKRGDPLSECARLCGSACFFCFKHEGGTVVCGNGSSAACDVPCTSTDDCGLTSPQRYCVSSSEDRATGAVTDVCTGGGGHCAEIGHCVI